MAKIIRKKRVGKQTLITVTGMACLVKSENASRARQTTAPVSPPTEPPVEPNASVAANTYAINTDRLGDARARSKDELTKGHTAIVSVSVPRWLRDYMEDFQYRAEHGVRNVKVSKSQIIAEAMALFYSANVPPPMQDE